MVAKGPPLQNTPKCNKLHWRKGALDETLHNNWCSYFKTGTKDKKVGGTRQCFGVEGLPIKGNWTETSICPIQIAILKG